MFRPLDRRERIVVTVGAAVSVVALSVSMLLLPWFEHATEREERIALLVDQLSRLEALIADGDATGGPTATRLTEERQDLARRLLPGETAAVAGSNLQVLLNRLVAASGLEVQRVDAVGPTDGEGALLRIPARLTARGEMTGLVELLHRVQAGDPLLIVDELRVGAGTAPRLGLGQLSRAGQSSRAGQLTISLGVHGYYRAEGATP